MSKTKIEWADVVWNPMSGCTKVSEGCRNCYAESIAKRFWGDRKFTDVQCHPERLDIPLHWKKPQRIFVDSMSDLFHEDIPEGFIDLVFDRVNYDGISHLTFLILTKRPERMKSYINGLDFKLPDNVWLGVSVEDQKTADERIPLLLQTPAAVRFISVEPMLENINISDALNGCPRPLGEHFVTHEMAIDAGDPSMEGMSMGVEWEQTAPPINWVICGSESGAKARPFDIDWVRSLRDQCVAAGVPFFLKQMPVNGKLAKMPELDGVVWDQYPELS
jgi:protein gp37